jgi:hypothetical protein
MRRRRLISAITFSAVLVLAQGAGAGIGFVPGEAINVAPDPDYLLAGDLTKDGRADLVVVSPASREVDVFAASPGAPSHVVPTQSLQFGSRLRWATSTQTAASILSSPTQEPTPFGY